MHRREERLPTRWTEIKPKQMDDVAVSDSQPRQRMVQRWNPPRAESSRVATCASTADNADVELDITRCDAKRTEQAHLGQLEPQWRLGARAADDGYPQASPRLSTRW